jgi:hypothetical protein
MKAAMVAVFETKRRRTTMTTNTKTTTQAPSHIVYFAPERDNAPWVRIGAMWPTKNGKGFRQVLDALPIIARGNIVVMPYEAGEQEVGQ